jgi:hypothetical protein
VKVRLVTADGATREVHVPGLSPDIWTALDYPHSISYAVNAEPPGRPERRERRYVYRGAADDGVVEYREAL